MCEEIGLRGSRHLDDSRILAKQAVVLDSDGDAGRIITSAPGQYQITARITGCRAHAASPRQEGISAIQVAAEAISQMRLLRVDQETTANIGSVSSQYATNIVPEVLDLAAEAAAVTRKSWNGRRSTWLSVSVMPVKNTGRRWIFR